MRQARLTYRLFVETGRCWGRMLGEDSGDGACQLCVEACPEVFEKSLPNRCANVRPGVDPSPHLRLIRQATKICPVNAIHLVREGHR